MDQERDLRIKRAERRTRIVMIVLGAPLLLWASLRLIGESVIPFQPYSIVSYAAEPKEGCVGDFIAIESERLIERPLLGSVDRIQTVTRWEQPPNASTPGGQSFSQPFSGKYGREVMVSPQDRLTPNAPGDWYLHVEIVVVGRVLGVERRQVIPSYNSPEIFTALPEDHPTCL